MQNTEYVKCVFWDLAILGTRSFSGIRPLSARHLPDVRLGKNVVADFYIELPGTEKCW